MPYPGYLQDLSQLVEDSLLYLSDTNSALIDDSPQEQDRKASWAIELTPSTLQDLLELDKAEDQEGEADKATLGHSPLSTNDSDWEEINSISTSTHELTSSVAFHFSPTTNMAPPLVNNPPAEEGGTSSMASPTLQEKAAMESSTIMIPSVSSTPLFIPIVQVDGQQGTNKITTPPPAVSQATTTLPMRNTDQVIADLKEKRSSPSAYPSSSFSPKRRLTSYASTRSESTFSDLPDAPIYSNANLPFEPSDDGDEDEQVDSSDEEDAQPAVKQRKVTERKRRLNAAADSYMEERTQKQLKEDNKVRPEDEAQQSARWLVNQSENREIISSPREYQVELFEKAKEKNIIAVLDTGTHFLPLFHSPANTFRFWQDFDCCPSSSTRIRSRARRQSNGQVEANLFLPGRLRSVGLPTTCCPQGKSRSTNEYVLWRHGL